MKGGKRHSPVVTAIREVEARCTAEIRVLVSRNWLEWDALQKAELLFQKFRMHQTQQANAVLIYVNLITRSVVLLSGAGVLEKLGPKFLEDLGKNLREDLYTTHHENALALCVRTLGVTFQKYFPRGNA